MIKNDEIGRSVMC